MEQKMRQKRQTPGMVQASDVRTVSAKGQNGFQSRTTSASSRGRELHGMPELNTFFINSDIYIQLRYQLNNRVFTLAGYDGPLQYTMTPGNPDSVISQQSNNHSHEEGKYVFFFN